MKIFMLHMFEWLCMDNDIEKCAAMSSRHYYDKEENIYGDCR